MRIIISLMIFNNDLTALSATDGLGYMCRSNTAHILPAVLDCLRHMITLKTIARNMIWINVCAAFQGRFSPALRRQKHGTHLFSFNSCVFFVMNRLIRTRITKNISKREVLLSVNQHIVQFEPVFSVIEKAIYAKQPAHTNIESMQPANRLNYTLCLCPLKPFNYSESV